MWILVIVLAGVILLGLVSGYFYDRGVRKKNGEGGQQDIPETGNADSECCGQHAVCEKESLLAAVSSHIEYYDDEELDRFKGRASDKYTEEETDEFREVMYTMREDEVAGWCRSLLLRGIDFPDGLKDELFLIVGERRFG